MIDEPQGNKATFGLATAALERRARRRPCHRADRPAAGRGAGAQPDDERSASASRRMAVNAVAKGTNLAEVE